VGRLARAAFLSLLQLVVLVALVFLPDVAQVVGTIFLLAMIPFLFVWGRVQADLAMNPLLDDVERTRWRIAVWCIPGAVALYWLRYVRPRRLVD
jgi:4-hydroxybenzoate polyprenyltransferase